ncbi:MAG: hypothetical protein PF569_07520 [Candidatus Woesearchaeota archaeon]|jgi:hypothetical protein|nr:hypothetical protein [Candidatus Woesearchaeota archaeon]
MDDEYELVAKSSIRDLKEENSKLKKENDLLKQKTLVPQKQAQPDTKLLSQIIQVINEESKKERETIINHLDDIKDLNKSTLDNLVTKTQSLDDRLEGMIGSLSGLVESMKDMLDHSSDSNIELISIELKNINSKLEKQITQPNSSIETKLEDIELFLKNLRILLSYVKPNDIMIDKNL